MTDFSDFFSVDNLMDKVNSLSGSGFCELIRKALTLYVLFTSDEASVASKALIIAALGYFICPVDAIPDFMPVVGYGDDLSVMGLLLLQLDDLISPAIEAEVELMMPSGCSE